MATRVQAATPRKQWKMVGLVARSCMSSMHTARRCQSQRRFRCCAPLGCALVMSMVCGYSLLAEELSC